jgi:natural product precursor
MKKLSKLKLNNVMAEELSAMQMKSIKGGDRYCTGSCLYANSGGSSSGANCSANYSLGTDGGYSKISTGNNYQCY